jgi:hypothetical protein
MDLHRKAGLLGIVVATGLVIAAAVPASSTGGTVPSGPRHDYRPVTGSAVVAPRPQPSQPPGPVRVAVLRSAVAHLADTGHNVTMKTASAVTTGSVDAADGTTAISINQDASAVFDEMVVGGTVYVRLNLDPASNHQLGVDPQKWMRLDPGKMPRHNLLPLQPDASDPVDMPGILDGVTAVRRVDATNYVGTIDLTKVRGHNLPDPIEVSAAGKPATRVPFRLTTDDQGRVLQFSVNASGFDPTLSLDVNYTNYGAQDTVSAPASSVPAPAGIYALFLP